MILTAMAASSLNTSTGTTKVNATTNLEAQVENVASQISLVLCLFSDSSAIWMPMASEKASAMAMAMIPPMTASFEWVLAFKPTIMPSVVITPEVSPKPKPFLMDLFTKGSVVTF